MEKDNIFPCNKYIQSYQKCHKKNIYLKEDNSENKCKKFLTFWKLCYKENTTEKILKKNMKYKKK